MNNLENIGSSEYRKLGIYFALPALLFAIGLLIYRSMSALLTWETNIGTELVVGAIGLLIGAVDAWLIQKAKDLKTAFALLRRALLGSFVVVLALFSLPLIYFIFEIFRTGGSGAEAFVFIVAGIFFAGFAVLRLICFVPSALMALYVKWPLK